jgi:hypothetical protein
MPDRLFHRPEDEELLARLFTQTPHEGLDMTPEDFAGKVGWRIYSEWCMSPTEGGKNEKLVTHYVNCNHYRYSGIAFEQFINDETHYLMSRKNMIGKMEGGVPSAEQQLEQRNRVMGALVKRAIDGFKKYGGQAYGWANGDNMRCNLQPWIGE